MFIFIRSFAFNIFFAIETILIAIFAVPVYFINKKYLKNIGKIWSFVSLTGLKYICGLSYKIEGNIPSEPGIIASKHQSAFECIIFWQIFDYPTFILKKELTKIPFVGFCYKVMEMIIIDRESMKDLMGLMPRAVKKSVVSDKRFVILFPEGTRVEYGERTKCKAALSIIQKFNDYGKIYPVALNTGKFWGKNSFLKYPGIAQIKFLEEITNEKSYKEINGVVEKLLDENSI